MSTLVSPVYTGTLNGKPLRFFKAPLPGPHLIWHASEDLQLGMQLPRDLRRRFREQLRSSEWSSDVRTVATSDGIVTIAPHWIAQGFIGAMIETGYISNTLEIAYAKEAVRAWNATTGDLPLAANVELMLAAFRNTNGIGANGGAV